MEPRHSMTIDGLTYVYCETHGRYEDEFGREAEVVFSVPRAKPRVVT